MAMLAGLVNQRERIPRLRLSVLLRPGAMQRHDAASQARHRQLTAWGVSVVTGDFQQQSVQALARCFAAYDVVINCSGFVAGAGTQLKITRAVLDAGVARYVPWQFGVDYDLIGWDSGQPVWDEQLQVRESLRAQRLTRWLIVSTGMFTSFLFEPAFGVVSLRHHRVRALGNADYALTLTTPEDIGRLTARILLHTPAIENEIVYIAGDTLSYRQLAERLGQHYRTPFTLSVQDVSALRDAVNAAPEESAAAYRLAFARPDGVAWDMSRTFNARHHIPMTDVQGWLAQRQP